MEARTRAREVRRGDRVFRRLTLGSGLLILVLIVAIAGFLVWKAVPAFRTAGFHFLTEKTWFPDAHPAKFGVAALAFGTVLSSVVALVMVVLSSIGLLVGGIGVMNIMLVSVTERTREIGIRKAIGARSRDIVVQFLTEAAVPTSVGGLLGIALGSGIGWAVHAFAGFPISLPWWSFAIGLGFSASVGLFFGMYPAFKASRLDPIEALRYE